jgi:radical SAM protein with 4Fe4S-binding SPASM domain
MTRLPSTTLAEQDTFIAFCNRHGARPSIVGTFNYKGAIASDLPVPSYPCEHVDRLDILCNGVVTLCCQDHEGEFSWGDVTRQSLLEAFNSETAMRYRTALRSGRRHDIEPCRRCNLFWFSLNGLPLARRAQVAAEAALYFVRHRPIGRRAPTADAATPLG